MNNGYKEWYKNCLNSLFEGQNDNWVYHVVQGLTEKSDIENGEEIIKDTKLRYRALLDSTLDVYTGDRMENKSYQLPFAMYYVAKSMFRDSVAAIASEALMTVANWDYRVRSNLLRFILLDDNPADSFLEKMTIFFMSLEKCRELEDVYMADCKDVSLAEYYPELIKEIECVDYEKMQYTLHRIRNSKKRYYLTYDNVLWSANEPRVPKELRGMYKRCVKSKSKYSHEGLEKELEDFIKQDINDYINKGYVASYNPFWIFGTKNYKENIDFIFSRKHVVEFDTVWLQYLLLKAECEGKNVEYISSFHNQKPKKMEVLI